MACTLRSMHGTKLRSTHQEADLHFNGKSDLQEGLGMYDKLRRRMRIYRIKESAQDEKFWFKRKYKQEEFLKKDYIFLRSGPASISAAERHAC